MVEDRSLKLENEAQEVCLRMLADRARSYAELVQRLETKGFTAAVIQKVLDRLATAGLVNDADFAEQWVLSRHTYSGKGKRALAVELKNKGISEEHSCAALNLIDSESERARAQELVNKKMRTMTLQLVDSGERNKAIRRLVSMLARRGYSSALAFEVVKSELSSYDIEIEENMA
ncbi:MAG: regulatory protein RecX [Mycobacteriaceae bacterium]